MRQVFNPDNLLWRTVAKGVDIVGLSFVWALLCIPVITIGPASAALYYTVVKCLRQKEKGTFGIFFRTFRDNFKQAALAELICLPVAAMLYVGYAVMRANWSSDLGAVMFVTYDIVLLIPCGIVCWLFPLLSRFQFTLKQAFRTAAMLCFRHIPSTVVVVLMTIELGVLCLERTWPLLLAPAVGALGTSLFFERIFPKYLREEDAKKLKITSETPVEEPEEESSSEQGTGTHD